nr:serine/threonine-protein phosphatase PGAM5, mitochondrial isoform X2 [Leptinotarsa decemlineata]
MSFSKAKRLLLGLGAVSGVVTICYLKKERNTVHAAWTTNYTPSAFAKWDDNWDHRSPHSITKPHKKLSNKEENKINEEKELSIPKACRHLILIRHGQYNLNAQKDEDRCLTKLGRLQAEYTGKRLKELNFPYTNIVKSTMCRASETGSIISEFIPNVPVSNCDLLREGAPVPPEPPIGGWKPENYYYQDGSRIEAAFRKYFHRAEPSQENDSYTLLVCHANVIRYFTCRALQFPAEAWLRLSLYNGSITWISITPSGRCILRVLGDTGHMPPDVITST